MQKNIFTEYISNLTRYDIMEMEITKIITTKGVCWAQHDTTVESQQGLPPEPVVLQSSLIRTRGSVS